MHVLISALSRFTEPTGICRHAANLALALDQSGAVERVSFVTGAWQERYFRSELGLESAARVRIEAVQIRNSSISRNLWFMRGLPELSRTLHADVVHLSFPVPVIRRSYNCKTVATLHDLYPYDVAQNFGYPNVLFVRMFLRTCLAGADAITCVSEVTRKRLATLYRARHIHKSLVIPNIVRMGAMPGTRPGNLRFEQYVLCVAQHRANKNLSLAIRGFAEMLAKRVLPNGTGLVIVGAPGPDTLKLERAVAELRLGNLVQFLSSLRETELTWMYQHCTLFLVTSTHEGFCLPLAEALYFGCPVVCSDIPVLREIGSEECCYFKLADSAATEIANVASVALKNGWREPSVKPHSSELAGQRYLELYSKLTGISLGAQMPARFLG